MKNIMKRFLLFALPAVLLAACPAAAQDAATVVLARAGAGYDDRVADQARCRSVAAEAPEVQNVT